MFIQHSKIHVHNCSPYHEKPCHEKPTFCLRQIFSCLGGFVKSDFGTYLENVLLDFQLSFCISSK